MHIDALADARSHKQIAPVAVGESTALLSLSRFPSLNFNAAN
jgi:hypothetical protein